MTADMGEGMAVRSMAAALLRRIEAAGGDLELAIAILREVAERKR